MLRAMREPTNPAIPVPRTLRPSRLRQARLAILAAAPLTLLFSARAEAGVTLVMQRGAEQPSTLYVDGDKMRMENPGAAARATVIINAATKRMTIVNEADKSYSEITPEDMKRFREQLESRRAQMEEHLKTMPPEQRKRIEEAMGPKMVAGAGPTKLPVLKFERTGEKKTINGFSCDTYHVLEDGTPKEEDCIAPWSSSVLQRSDFAGLRKFAEDMAKSSGTMSPGGGRQMFEQFDKYPGFPVLRHPLDPGHHDDEQLKSVKRGPIPAASFTPPAGFTKKDLPMGAMGGGGPPRGSFRPLPAPSSGP
jgi:hypothetical protein